MQQIYNLLLSSYPNALALFLGGSSIKGTFDQFSDYDFTVITKGPSKSYVCLSHEGRKIDLCIWGIDHLRSTLCNLDYLNPKDQELAYIISQSQIISGKKTIEELRSLIKPLDEDDLRQVGVKAFSILNNSKLHHFLKRLDHHGHMNEICELNKWICLYQHNIQDQFYPGTPKRIHPLLLNIQNLSTSSEPLIRKTLFKIRSEICTSLNTLLSTTSNSEAQRSKMPRPYLISSNSIEQDWNPPSTGFMA